MKTQHRLLSLFAILVIAFISLHCSSDILKITKAPVIGTLEASAYEVDPGDTVTVSVSVQEANGEVLYYDWNASRGQLLLPSDQASVRWVAPSEGGRVTITVWVSNEEKSANQSTDITVRSYTRPFVSMEYPDPNAFIVLNDNMEIEARASHNNGIDWVYFYVNDVYTIPLNRKSGTEDTYIGNYQFQGVTGELELKVSARALTTGTTGSDSLTVHVEGIIPGKR